MGWYQKLIKPQTMRGESQIRLGIVGSTNPPLEQWMFIKLPNPGINWISDEMRN